MVLIQYRMPLEHAISTTVGQVVRQDAADTTTTSAVYSDKTQQPTPPHCGSTESEPNVSPCSPASLSPSADEVFSEGFSQSSVSSTKTTFLAGGYAQGDEALQHQSDCTQPMEVLTALPTSESLQLEGTVPPVLRQNPRRTISDNGSAVRKPPALVRQDERRENFVENLVGKLRGSDRDSTCLLQPQDTSTQMIEVIWPHSTESCSQETSSGVKSNVIDLRIFVQEVLKRSRSSYSTLQVALYYLILIKPCIPKIDFGKEHSESSHDTRVMHCGRRMFLAALILASKWLQDKNYTARAWSKISGLKHDEINANELAFLKAVGWNIHVSELQFQRWVDIVYRFSPNSTTPPHLQHGDSFMSWRAVVARLTPALDENDIQGLTKSMPIRKSENLPKTMSPPPIPNRYLPQASTTLPGSTPKVLEPPVRAVKHVFRFPSTPISPQLPHLLTPQIPSISGRTQRQATYPGNTCWTVPETRSLSGFSRSPSAISNPSTNSSPESSRYSRASSVSSMSSVGSFNATKAVRGVPAKVSRHCIKLPRPVDYSQLTNSYENRNAIIEGKFALVDKREFEPSFVPVVIRPTALDNAQSVSLEALRIEQEDTDAAMILRDMSNKPITYRSQSAIQRQSQPLMSDDVSSAGRLSLRSGDHMAQSGPMENIPLGNRNLNVENRGAKPTGSNADKMEIHRIELLNELQNMTKTQSLSTTAKTEKAENRKRGHVRSVSGSSDCTPKRSRCESVKAARSRVGLRRL